MRLSAIASGRSSPRPFFDKRQPGQLADNCHKGLRGTPPGWLARSPGEAPLAKQFAAQNPWRAGRLDAKNARTPLWQDRVHGVVVAGAPTASQKRACMGSTVQAALQSNPCMLTFQRSVLREPSPASTGKSVSLFAGRGWRSPGEETSLMRGSRLP